MNVNSLYRLASLLDTEGKYLEADVVLDSMIRLAQVRPEDAIKFFDLEHGTKIDKNLFKKLQRNIAKFHPDVNPNNPNATREFQRAQQMLNALREGEGLDVKRSQATRQRHEQAKQQTQQSQQRQPAQETQQPRQQTRQQPRQQQPRQLSGDVIDQNPNTNPSSNQNQQVRQQTQQTRSNANPASSAGPETGPRPGGNTGRGPTNPGGASPRPQPGASVRNTPPGVAGARPFNIGQMNNDVRMRVWNNRNLNPRLYDLLELEYSAGRFNPKTGDLVESAVESLGRAFEKGGPTVVSKGGKGAQMVGKAVEFANRAKNAPGAQSIANALGKVSKTLSFLKPLTKLLPFLGFALSIPDFVRLCNRINQEGWEPIWNDPYDRAKAIGAISNTVAAAVSIAPGPLTPVAAALAAIGMGSDLGADVARDAGDAAEGGEFKLFGKTLKQKSKQRQQQDAFEAGLNAKTIDPQVHSALSASKRMLMAGSKIVDIMNDPKMKSIYPWLGTGDARDAQFRVQITALRKSLRAGGGEEQVGQEQQQAPGPYLNKAPYGSQPQSAPQAAGQQGQPVYNNSQQPQQQPQQLRNHNDLLYKAYVDTVQNTNVTLDNLKNYREQIITKINNLSPMYPNINAQQAITALDNRIRKYSAQAA
jgi:hypothetical protein